jgi:hypothetical protein
MRFVGEVLGQKHLGDEVAVSVGNVRRVSAAEWRDGGQEVVVNVPLSAAAVFAVGRGVTIDVKATRERRRT